MIELIAIFLQIFVFLIILSFPFNPKSLNKLFSTKLDSFNYIDCHAINIIIFINILLVTSFFKIQLTHIFLVLFSISIIFLIIRKKEYLLMINKKNLNEFIFFFIITISLFVSTSYAPRLEWDGFAWITKTLVFFNNEPIQNLRYTVFPEYPHLASYIWAFFWKNSLLEYEYFGRFFHIYIYIVSMFTIFNITNFKSKNMIYLLIFSLILITYDQFLFGGYQTYLLFSILLIASRFIITVNFNNNIEYNKIYFILFILSSVVWIKDEGMFYFLIFGSLLIFLQKCTLREKIIPIFTIFLVIYIQYYLQKNVVGIYGFVIEPFSQGFINQILDFKFVFTKTLAITKHIIIASFKYPLWILIFFSFMWARIFNKETDSRIKYFFYALVLNILLIYSVYLHDTNPDPIVLSVTLDRVMFQTSGFYFLIFILMLNKNENNYLKF